MSTPDVKVDELVAKDHGTKIKTFEGVAAERDAQKLEEEKNRVSVAPVIFGDFWYIFGDYLRQDSRFF